MQDCFRKRIDRRYRSGTARAATPSARSAVTSPCTRAPADLTKRPSRTGRIRPIPGLTTSVDIVDVARGGSVESRSDERQNDLGSTNGALWPCQRFERAAETSEQFAEGPAKDPGRRWDEYQVRVGVLP